MALLMGTVVLNRNMMKINPLLYLKKVCLIMTNLYMELHGQMKLLLSKIDRLKTPMLQGMGCSTWRMTPKKY